MTAFNRRDFLQTSIATGAAWGMMSSVSQASANEQINVGLIGAGGRGTGLAGQFEKVSGVKLVAAADPEDQALKRISKNRPDLKTYKDLRKLLDDPSIDAVIVATCNHWHCLAAIWAMQAGKHVYVEKPLSHSQWEGEQVVAAAEKYNKIVQVGTQQRSDPMQEELKAFLHEEQALGTIQSVVATRFGTRGSIGKRDTPLPIPKTVDYDLWLGPGEDLPIYRNKLHYDWHWVWNTGSGEMGNWGVHILDDVRNVVFRDQSKLPQRIIGGGGRVAWDDAGETPNVHFAYLETGTIPVVMGLSNLKADPDGKKPINYLGSTSGYVVHCEGGYLAGKRGGAKVFDKDGKQIKSFKGDAGKSHQANFIEAVRTGNSKILKTPVRTGHDSTGWCNVINIAQQVGRPFNRQQAESIAPDSSDWNQMLDQMTSHLTVHGIDINSEQIQLGPILEIDTKAERFTGAHAEQANSLIKRTYRAPYSVPEIS